MGCPMSDEESKWKPAVAIEFFEAGGHEFHNAVNRFRDWAKDQPRNPTPLLDGDGWYEITPPLAEELLKRNTRNRPLDWNFVLAYGSQMHNGRWKKTGEPIIINGNGDVDDAGHRLWAGYLSRSTFTSYVVHVEADPDLFAFIDNGRSRSGTDTLVTAGLGQSANLLARVVKEVAMPFDERSLSYFTRMPRTPITNIDILDYIRAHPELAETVRTVRDLYPAAVKRIGETAVACFIGWKIHTIYGSGTLEDFYGALVRTDLPATNPIAVLQKRLDDHLAAIAAPVRSPKKKLRLTPTKVLALTIRAFNLWRASQTTRRLDPRADDPFPDFDQDLDAKEAAE